MFNSIDSGADRVWEVLNKITSINLWPYVIGLLIFSLGLSFLIQYLQIKRASKQFAAGMFDDKTVQLCECIKRRSILPQAAELHDIFCYRLSAMYMAKNDESRFFENINSIKNVTLNISWRIYLLLTAYLTNQSYLDTVTTYRANKTDNCSTVVIARQLLREYDMDTIADKAIIAKEMITNQQILEILHTLTANETEDDTLS